MTCHPQRAILHPGGEYLYVLHETLDLIQTFAVDEVRRMVLEACLQEINLVGKEPFQLNYFATFQMDWGVV